MKEVTVRSEAKVLLTPEMMAEGFWELSSVEQAKFWEHLGRTIKCSTEPSGVGCFQWAYMVADLKEGNYPNGVRVLESIAGHMTYNG